MSYLPFIHPQKNFEKINVRFQLYVMTGADIPVLANERLFTTANFQRDEGLKTANHSYQNSMDIEANLDLFMESVHGFAGSI